MDNLEEMDKFLERYKTEPERYRKYKQTYHKYWSWIDDKESFDKQKSRTRWLHRWVLSNI